MHNDPILFVDDNLLSNLEACEFLRDHGRTVIEAHSAAGALAVIANQPLSALVTEVHHGAGPDGYEVARCARAAHPHLAVVFISGTSADRHAAEGVAGSAFVPKPFHSWQILAALDGASCLEAA